MEEDKSVHMSYKVSPRNFKSIEVESEDLNISYQERRSCRHFSFKPLPKELIENLIRIAASAPSGAHKQPWHFVAISDPILKRRLGKRQRKRNALFIKKEQSITG